MSRLDAFGPWSDVGPNPSGFCGKQCYEYHLCEHWVCAQPNQFASPRKAATALNEWCRSTTLPHGQIMRAKVILQLSEGMAPTEVAAAQRTSAKTVHRWRNRFEAEGTEGLLELARSGRPTVITKKTVDRVMFLTTKRIPEEATH